MTPCFVPSHSENGEAEPDMPTSGSECHERSDYLSPDSSGTTRSDSWKHSRRMQCGRLIPRSGDHLGVTGNVPYYVLCVLDLGAPGDRIESPLVPGITLASSIDRANAKHVSFHPPYIGECMCSDSLKLNLAGCWRSCWSLGCGSSSSR